MPATSATKVQGLMIASRSPGTVPVSALTETLATPSSRPAATASSGPLERPSEPAVPESSSSDADPDRAGLEGDHRGGRIARAASPCLHRGHREKPQANRAEAEAEPLPRPDARRRTSAGPARREAPGRPRWSSRTSEIGATVSAAT